MIKSRYYSESELQRIVSDTELELDRREAQRAEEQRMQAFTAWANDPRNKSIIDNDPMVQKLRAMSNPAPQRQAPAPQPVQRIGFSNAAIDPKVHSPSVKPNSTPAPVRFGPGAPAIPPNGFWVL